MDQPKMERLLRLMMLLVGNNHYTVTQLANRLNTSSRSIYRYLDTFKEAGFAIYREGEHVRMGKESPLFKDLSQLIHFSQEEAYMVHQLIEGIDNSNVIKQNLKQKLAAIYNSKIIAHSVVKGKHADNVRKLLEAYEQKRQVILHGYSSAHGKAISDRVVEPFAFTTNYVNVWCYEPKDGKNKLFKLARIDWVEIREEAWQHDALHKEGYIDIFRMHSYGDARYPVVLSLNRRAYNLLTEEFPLSERYIIQLSADEWLLQTEVSNFVGITRFILGLAADIRIVESKELQEYVREYGERYILGVG